MLFGIHEVPVSLRPNIAALLEKERNNPYRYGNIKPALPERIAAWLDLLKKHDLDVEAALHVLAAVEYVTDAEINQSWQNAGERLERWLGERALDRTSEAYFLQVRQENHIADLFQACGWPRRDAIVPDTLWDLWSRIDSISRGQSNYIAERNFKSIAERRVWVLLWDMNLSGDTIAKEIGRLCKCIDMMPNALPRQLLVLGALQTERASRTVFDRAAVLRLNLETIFNRTISARECVREHHALRSMHGRVLALCAGIHDLWIRSAQQQELKRTGPEGYANTGLLIVREQNSPNNSLPLLWLAVDDYAGPFPRVPPSSGGFSESDPRLDALDTQEITAIAADLAHFLETPMLERRECVAVRAWKKDTERAFLHGSDPDQLEDALRACSRILQNEHTRQYPAIRAQAELARTLVMLAQEDASWGEAWAEYLRLDPDNLDLGKGIEGWEQLVQKQISRLVPTLGQRDATRPRLPEYRYSASGPPPALILTASDDEPRTTRVPASAEVFELLKEAVARREGGLWFIVGPAGWGKSIFVRMALQSLTSAALHVDLSDCESQEDLAYRLLAGHVGAEEQAVVDRNPAAAIDILDRALAHPTVIVFEDTHRTSSGRPAEALEQILAELVKRGHIVLCETWSRDVSLLARPDHGQVHRIDRQMLGLNQDEVQAWSRAVLRRNIPEDAVLYFELLAGHPGLTKAVLETVRLDGRHTAEAITEAVIEVAETSHDPEFEAFIEHGSTPGEEALPDVIVCWLAVLPWAEAPEAILEGATKQQLRRLYAVRLISRLDASDVWQGYAWGRTLAMRRLLADPSILVGQQHALTRLCDRVPTRSLRAQRRHVAALLARMRDSGSKDILTGLLRDLPIPEAAPQGHDDAVRIEKPMLIHKQEGLPPDILVIAMEGAARKGNTESFAWLAKQLSINSEIAISTLSRDWVSLKALHSSLLTVPLSIAQKVGVYETIAPVMCSILKCGDDLAKAWCVRLLTFAARAAFTAMRPEVGTGWLSASREAHGTIQVPADGTVARSVYDDTTYRIRRTECELGTDFRAIVELHERALSSIPPIERQHTSRFAQWDYRVLRHIRPILRFRGSDGGLTARLAHALDRLPAALQWFDHFLRFDSELEELPEEIGPILQQALQRKINLLRDDHTADPRLLALAEVCRSGCRTKTAVARMREVASRLGHALDTTDFCIFARALEIARRTRPDEPTGREVATCCAKLLGYLGVNALHFASDRVAVLLRRQCLAYMVYHHFAPVRAALREEKPTNRAGTDAMRRIRAMYVEHAKLAADPWLWLDYADAAVEGVRSHAITTDALSKVHEEVEKAISGHPAADAAAVRLLRYEWRFEECLVRALSLLERQLSSGEHLRVVRLVESVLRPLVFEQLVRYWTPPRETAEKLSTIYRSVLAEAESMIGRASERRWARAAIQVLDGEDREDFWQRLAGDLAESIKIPDALWQNLVDRALSDDVPSSRSEVSGLVSDMTDSGAVGLSSFLLRIGASKGSLPIVLRRQLADLAVASAIDAEMWETSIRIRPTLVTTYRVAIAVGIALSISEDGVVLKTQTAPTLSRKRRRELTWKAFMKSRLDSVKSRSGGDFREFVDALDAKLQDMTVSVPS